MSGLLQLWNQISGPVVLMLIVGSFRMYARVEGHSADIKQLKEEFSDSKKDSKETADRLRSVEGTLIELNTNVKELLRVQRSESPYRNMDKRA